MENKCILIGDVVRVDGLATVGNNIPTLNFFLRTWSILTDGRTYFEYHPIQVWGDTVQRAKGIITVGAVLRVEGAIAHQSWEDRYGQRRRKTLIRATGVKPMRLEVPEISEQEKRKFNDPADKQLKLEPQD